jgi:hypothetical protein
LGLDALGYHDSTDVQRQQHEIRHDAAAREVAHHPVDERPVDLDDVRPEFHWYQSPSDPVLSDLLS